MTAPGSGAGSAPDPQPAQAFFAGHQPRECGEHRTVGAHRAWCFDCSEWCYPDRDDSCKGCVIPYLRERLADATAGAAQAAAAEREAIRKTLIEGDPGKLEQAFRAVVYDDEAAAAGTHGARNGRCPASGTGNSGTSGSWIPQSQPRALSAYGGSPQTWRKP